MAWSPVLGVCISDKTCQSNNGQSRGETSVNYQSTKSRKDEHDRVSRTSRARYRSAGCDAIRFLSLCSQDDRNLLLQRLQYCRPRTFGDHRPISYRSRGLSALPHTSRFREEESGEAAARHATSLGRTNWRIRAEYRSSALQPRNGCRGHCIHVIFITRNIGRRTMISLLNTCRHSSNVSYNTREPP